MSLMTEPNNLADILVWEQERGYSREQVTVLSGESLSLGEVVGQVKRSTPTTGTADGENTGTGACTSVTAGAKTKIGTYTLTCTAAATNGGTFAVMDPAGIALPDSVVGEAYANSNINFTISDGGTDFAVGDVFTITVTAGSGKVVPIDFTAVDGSADAAGFTIAAYDASAADVEGVIISSDAIITTSNLVWPAGAGASQKAAALAQLADFGVIERGES